jgi:hypothetical protein
MVSLDSTMRKLKKHGFNSESDQVKKAMLEVSIAIQMIIEEKSNN